RLRLHLAAFLRVVLAPLFAARLRFGPAFLGVGLALLPPLLRLRLHLAAFLRVVLAPLLETGLAVGRGHAAVGTHRGARSAVGCQRRHGWRGEQGYCC